jgi:hypothetical protein
MVQRDAEEWKAVIKHAEDTASSKREDDFIEKQGTLTGFSFLVC